jgi:hypothetical protein
MAFMLKTYAVTVEGFPAYNYEAATPAQARSSAWHSYRNYRDVPFREFLRISSIRRADDPQGFGRLITVGGLPAHWVGWNGQYVRFVRPDSTVIVLSHPADVVEAAA